MIIAKEEFYRKEHQPSRSTSFLFTPRRLPSPTITGACDGELVTLLPPSLMLYCACNGASRLRELWACSFWFGSLLLVTHSIDSIRLTNRLVAE